MDGTTDCQRVAPSSASGEIAFAPDDNMRTALDALAAEHGVGVRLPRAASRSGLSIWLVSRRIDALTHSFKHANHGTATCIYFYTLICNQPAA